MEENIENKSESPEDDNWLDKARDAFEQSTDWFDSSIRHGVEKAMAHFNNKHAPGSKYHSDSYKFRAKGFRPKTRASIRRNEAAAATAFFSTADVVSIQAENPEDKNQLVSAGVLTELLNYRLDDSIPWFQTVIGTYQDALNVGVCISHQYWDFKEDVKQYPAMDEMGAEIIGENGEPETQEVRKILLDNPVIDVIAIENFRISPAADWRDPIGTTPYIIEMIPMYIGDVEAKMESGEWIEYEEGEIQAATKEQYDSIQSARDGKRRADSRDVIHATSDFNTVWVHRNIIREDGEDYIFYTLGTHLRLSEPVPLRKQYKHLRHGERPYVMGSCLIEAHKNYPAGLNELTAPLQEDANDVGNQRRDNVSLAMNKRYFANRTANIDYKSLTRNVPGSVTLVDNINSDIKWDSPGEVTGSAYQEQDRINMDYDELAGAFSPGSIASNRKLGETVGGMNMLQGDSNILTEYQLRVYAETWAEPALKQLVRMEAAYETDPVVLAIAGQRAKLFQKFGVSEVSDAMLQGLVNVRVNVGFGSTNPQQRIERLAMGLQSIAGFVPQLMQGLDGEQVVGEVFGALGYKDGKRFFPQIGQEQNPQIAQMQQTIQQLQQMVQGKEMEIKGRIEAARVQGESRVQVEQVRQQGNVVASRFTAAEAEKDRMLEQWIAQVDAQIKSAELAGSQDMTLQSLKVMLAKEAMSLRTQKELAFSQANAPQVAESSFEPAGKAPNGEAFQR